MKLDLTREFREFDNKYPLRMLSTALRRVQVHDGAAAAPLPRVRQGSVRRVLRGQAPPPLPGRQGGQGLHRVQV